MTGGDEYTAVWVSHSSIADFLKCPRAYFLRNIYKDPVSNRKISLINPTLSLGQAVHGVLESLSILPVKKRFDLPLLERFDRIWQKISGARGGFGSRKQEEVYKRRGERMLKRILKNPGPIGKLAVKIKADLPYYWLSEKDNLILCGKIDWLEYFSETDRVRVVDFKTGRGIEDENSLQLLIYCLLASNCQRRKVMGASYWYLDRDDQPTKPRMPDLDGAYKRVLAVAKRIKLARQLEKFTCPAGKEGCRYCRPLEKIIAGEALLVGVNDFGQNVYVLKKPSLQGVAESEIL